MRKWSLKSCKSFQQGTGTENEVRFECAQEVRKAKKPKKNNCYASYIKLDKLKAPEINKNEKARQCMFLVSLARECYIRLGKDFFFRPAKIICEIKSWIIVGSLYEFDEKNILFDKVSWQCLVDLKIFALPLQL